jgi:predicted nucleic acid-binding protein
VIRGGPGFSRYVRLVSSTLNDTLLRIAEEDAFRPQWSATVLAELRTVLEREAGLAPDRAARRIAHMQAAFPTAEVIDFETLIDIMTCDPKDRHVLAAAVAGGSAELVTFNLGDFPDESVAPHNIHVVSPDSFLLDQLDLHPAKVGRALVGQMSTARRPRLMMGQLLGRLTRAGVPAFAEEARRLKFA